MAEGLDYAGSGVDIDLEGNAVGALVGALSRSVRKPGSPGAPVDLPGGFGGLVEFGDNYLALATDGVGSKLSIATKLNILRFTRSMVLLQSSRSQLFIHTALNLRVVCICFTALVDYLLWGLEFAQCLSVKPAKKLINTY